MNVALLVAYDGTDLSGFARQRTARTVQGLLEERLSLLCRVPIAIVGAGRTDAGVHASGQVVSFEAPGGTDPLWLRDRLNRWLAPEIAVRSAAEVPEGFSARFSALRRAYEYRLYRADVPDPFLDRFTVHVPGRLDLAAMRRAGRALLGEHDFSAFCRKGPGSMVRRLRAVTIATEPGRLTFKVSADAFCHQMVRAIVGFLLAVGGGKRDAAEAAAVLAGRDRSRAAELAPARGLHLVAVRYRPDPFA